MTIDEAIDYLKTEASLLHAQGFYIRENAVVLGIEALKTLKDVRITYNISPLYLLPGETKE